tara:strand:- start:449 stop:592 length:144 start_codon:yes stop_codon:yes gene_type:complete
LETDCEARKQDMTIKNNPYEIMSLERLVEDQTADYIGKAALAKLKLY